ARPRQPAERDGHSRQREPRYAYARRDPGCVRERTPHGPYASTIAGRARNRAAALDERAALSQREAGETRRGRARESPRKRPRRPGPPPVALVARRPDGR